MASYRSSPAVRNFTAPPPRRPLQLHRQSQSDYPQQQDAGLQQEQQQQQQQLLPQRNPNRVSVRPPSSLYSQPSPINTTFPAAVQRQHPPEQPQQDQQLQKHQHSYQQPYQNYPDQASRFRDDDGVSPPSSPELFPESRYLSHDRRDSSPDISPLDDTPPNFAMLGTTARSVSQTTPTQDRRPTSSSSRSNIPMMRRERRQTQESQSATTRTLRETKSRERLQQMQGRSNSNASSLRGYKGGEVRWDPRTGELTSSEKGRPGQVKPAEYARGLGKPGSASPTDPVVVTAAAPATAVTGMASFANRLRRTMQSSTSTAVPTAVSSVAAAVDAGPGADMTAAAGQMERIDAGPSLEPASPRQPSQSPTPAALPKSPRAPAEVSSSAKERTAIKDPAAGAFASDRPAWQGASGRTTLVAPVRDMPHVAPLNIPRKSSKRVPSVSKLTDRSATQSTLSSPPASPPRDETLNRPAVGRVVPLVQHPAPTNISPPSPSASDADAAAARNYPSPPLSEAPVYKQSLPSQLQGNDRQEAQESQRPPSSQIRRKPTPSHHNLASFDANDPFNYNNKITPSSTSSPFAPREPASDLEWTQPPSRFSVTTYNSTLRESLHDFDTSAAPEMPSIPNSLWSSPSPPDSAPTRKLLPQYDGPTAGQAQQPSPPTSSPKALLRKALDSGNVMDRRRPPRLGYPNPNSIKDGNEPIVISLKTPWMRGHAGQSGSADSGNSSLDDSPSYRRTAKAQGDNAQTRTERTVSVAGSVHKVLPPAPPETAAKDRVAMLNARLAGLAQRRVNIDRSIKQMTELMPTDNLLAAPDVLLKREQEKHKVEGLRTELSEIQREEYEIGLKLHRAYKRFDQNAEYEPTTLWVRRVTG